LNGVWKKKQWMSVAADKLVGAPLSDERIQSVVTVIMTEVDPPSDHLGSAAYRRAMAGVMTRQVLEACR
jgi:CO/xanthine dehydrogenase FAD-binding subunit